TTSVSSVAAPLRLTVALVVMNLAFEVGEVIVTTGGDSSFLADWITVKLRPAMFIVPARTEALMFDSAVKLIVPLPTPLFAPFILIQLSPLALTPAAHWQPFGAETFTLPAPPAALIVTLAGESE